MAKLNIKLSKQQQQILIAAVIFLGGGGFAYVKYFWMPTSAKIRELREELTRVEEDIKVAKDAQIKYNKIVKELETLEAELKVLIESLPKDKDLPGVIDKMTQLTRKHNIRLTAISYVGDTPGKGGGYAEVNYTLAIQASYHDLGKFLAALALEKRLFCARNVAFSGADKDGKFTMNLQLVAYQYLE